MLQHSACHKFAFMNVRIVNLGGCTKLVVDAKISLLLQVPPSGTYCPKNTI